MDRNNFSPRIVGFLCKWCAYSGADLAGVSREKYPPNMFPIRVMCSGRVDPLFLVKAHLYGADSVMIGGCHPGDCHYNSGNLMARRRFAVLKEVLENTGLEADRLKLHWIAASEGSKYARTVEKLTAETKKKGPNPIGKEIFI